MALTQEQEQAIAMASARLRLKQKQAATQQAETTIGATPEQPPEQPSFYAESVRKGLSNFPALAAGVAGGAANIVNSLIGADKFHPTTSAISHYDRVKYGSMGMLGSTGAKPASSAQRIAGAAIEGAADPLTYALPIGIVGKGAGMAAQTAYKALSGAAAGAGSEVGGMAGKQIGEIVGGETGGKVGQITGALAGGIGGGVMAGRVPLMSEKIYPRVKEYLSGKISGANAKMDAHVHAAVRNVFRAAADADPNFAKTISDAVEASDRTGIPLPISSIVRDNPVIASYIQNIAMHDPVFKAKYWSQWDDAHKALSAKSDKTFGTLDDANKAYTQLRQERSLEASANKLMVNEQLKKFESGAASKSSKVDSAPLSHELGGTIEKAVDAAEKRARAETNPEYTKAFDIAKAKDVVLPEYAVNDIREFVIGGKAGDLFKSFPDVYNKVEKLLDFPGAGKAPKALGTELILPSGVKQAQKGRYEGSIEGVDSLKREINRSLRATNEPSDIRILQSLKEKLNTHIDALDPEFVNAYRHADAVYLSKVGLPFNETAIKSIGRAKYDEDIVPILTKNRSALSQFLTATGESGKKLADDAFHSDFVKFAMRDGIIDPKRSKAWFEKHKAALELVPDTKTALQSASKDVETLINRRNTLQSQFDERVKADLEMVSGETIQDAVTKMYGSPKYADDYMRQFGGNREYKNAVRSYMLDDITKSANPLDALNDRNMKHVYNRVFGSQFAQKVHDFALLSDRLTTNPASVRVHVPKIGESSLMANVGFSPERATSLFFTNPVVSHEVAFVTLLNSFIKHKTHMAANEELKRVLLDKDLGKIILNSAVDDKTLNLGKLSNGLSEYMRRTGTSFIDILKSDMKAGATRSTTGMDGGEQSGLTAEEEEELKQLQGEPQ